MKWSKEAAGSAFSAASCAQFGRQSRVALADAVGIIPKQPPSDMTLRETSLPLDLLHLREGESVVGYQILEGQITFKMISSEEVPTPSQIQKKDISEWINRWAGSLKLDAGETRDSLRAAAMQEKFDS